MKTASEVPKELCHISRQMFSSQWQYYYYALEKHFELEEFYTVVNYDPYVVHIGRPDPCLELRANSPQPHLDLDGSACTTSTSGSLNVHFTFR